MLNSEIQFLLSKAAMKKAGLTMLEKNVKLSLTESGQYCIPKSNMKQLISQNGKDQIKVGLHVSDLSSKCTEEKRKMVLKLQEQFSHASRERLRSLVASSGIKGQEFLKLIETVPGSDEFEAFGHLALRIPFSLCMGSDP